jgi:hypothetical protein
MKLLPSVKLSGALCTRTVDGEVGVVEFPIDEKHIPLPESRELIRQSCIIRGHRIVRVFIVVSERL